jgi:hypothetical protein
MLASEAGSPLAQPTGWPTRPAPQACCEPRIAELIRIGEVLRQESLGAGTDKHFLVRGGITMLNPRRH